MFVLYFIAELVPAVIILEFDGILYLTPFTTLDSYARGTGNSSAGPWLSGALSLAAFYQVFVRARIYWYSTCSGDWPNRVHRPGNNITDPKTC